MEGPGDDESTKDEEDNNELLGSSSESDDATTAPSNGLEALLLELIAEIEGIASSIAATALRLEQAAGQLEAAFDDSSSPDQNDDFRDGFMSLLKDAKLYERTLKKGGIEILRSADALWGTEEDSGISIITEGQNALNNARLLLGVLGHVRAFLAAYSDVEFASLFPMETNVGSKAMEFEIRSSGPRIEGEGAGEDSSSAGSSRRRALLIAGGMSTSRKKSSLTRAVEDLAGEDQDPRALARVVGNAFAGGSWSLMKQYGADDSIARLPGAPMEQSATSHHLKDGLLFHLTRKVRACGHTLPAAAAAAW